MYPLAVLDTPCSNCIACRSANAFLDSSNSLHIINTSSFGNDLHKYNNYDVITIINYNQSLLYFVRLDSFDLLLAEELAPDDGRDDNGRDDDGRDDDGRDDDGREGGL